MSFLRLVPQVRACLWRYLGFRIRGHTATCCSPAIILRHGHAAEIPICRLVLVGDPIGVRDLGESLRQDPFGDISELRGDKRHAVCADRDLLVAARPLG
jgi:hypothetical protein